MVEADDLDSNVREGSSDGLLDALSRAVKRSDNETAWHTHWLNLSLAARHGDAPRLRPSGIRHSTREASSRQTTSVCYFGVTLTRNVHPSRKCEARASGGLLCFGI